MADKLDLDECEAIAKIAYLPQDMTLQLIAHIRALESRASNAGGAVAAVRTYTYEGIARNGVRQEAVMLDGAPELPDGSLLYTASNTCGVVAWVVTGPDGKLDFLEEVYQDRDEGQQRIDEGCIPGCYLTPLYRHPAPASKEPVSRAAVYDAAVRLRELASDLPDEWLRSEFVGVADQLVNLCQIPDAESKEPVADERAMVRGVPKSIINAITAYGDARADGKDTGEAIGNAVSAIRAALATAQTWQPIETAPKDGARHLVKCSHIGRCVASESFDIDGNSEGWFLVNDIKVSPTHWMPLPAAPAKPEGV